MNEINLENGLVVDTRNGDRFIIINDRFMNVNLHNWHWVSDYNKDFNFDYEREYDIMKIYKSRGYSLSTLSDDSYLDLIWEREDCQDIKTPAIYKHFKGNFYATMGIAHRLNGREFYDTIIENEDCSLEVQFTENDVIIQVLKKDDEYYYYNCHIPEYVNDIVLYKSLYDDSLIYTRPLDMFASKVDKVKYPDTEQEWRFELYKY